MINRYSNFTAAYLDSLRQLHDKGSVVSSVTDVHSVGSDFGQKDRPFRELLNHTFVLSNPCDRVVKHSSRRLNVPFAVANAIWTLAGSDSLAFIAPYNPRGEQFSDDGQTLHGAHGKRLFDSGGVDQVRAALHRLRADPQSRRAVAVIMQGSDSVSSSRDIPCVISLQFIRRAGELHCMVNMRSQSAAMVLPYDVFAFSFLQECLAVELGVRVGRYYHNSGSFHYYLDEEPLVRRLLSEPASQGATSLGAPAMPPEPSPFAAVDLVLEYEDKVRQAVRAGHSAASVPLPLLPRYWKDIALLLACGLSRAAGLGTEALEQQLSAFWAWAMEGMQPALSRGACK